VKRNNLEQAKERIKAINWKYDDRYNSIAGSSMFLVKEFLRRAALCAEIFGLINLPGSGWPILDYAAYIDPLLKIEEEEDEFYPVHDELDAQAEVLHVNCLSLQTKRVCVYFVHWAEVKDRPKVIEHDLVDPYEPLIVLYERGGNFRRDHSGVWEYHHTSGFPVYTPSDHLSSTPIIELDETSLDRADEEFKISQ
jgi:hypothetical protein